ncbi:hypothetical protein HanRHA438_Chr06g0260461 [Helianthus annuus]|uniref:Uncharacterized protein n=1 Tax=Helianthus annuus TaxID=4232 RepID=A0A9K3ITE8_HELAN|nr:hypothetical protein HanXRQr2_Chr06g0251141 [Helianthus annuus]KAJ0559965.1 hypothetical protein HanHA300_Chr06g0206291 [Helianthus annuus]KAJ0572953.1 hypothetical protein HanHA89_Chr06g0221431 [Helianthus annuus]KAJ0911183.1 hypothetical protein HanRHA438_Chr06g0260461 [Helianthus annuus]
MSTQEDPISSYLGISFALFLATLPTRSLSLIPYLQTHNESLAKKLLNAEEQLEQLYSRRKEDYKANARVVEIFASHRHGWQQEEKRLLRQIDDDVEEIANLRAKIEDLEIRVLELQREVSERDELLNFMSNNNNNRDDDGEFYGKFRGSDENVNCNEKGYYNVDDLGSDVFDGHNNMLFNGLEFSDSAVSKFLAERSNSWQGVQYEPVERVHNLKHCVTRRESPWKVDGDSSGVSAKLKLLEQELQNLENIGANDLSKVPSLMKKQAKRYQALAGKIDDLCKRMENDPCEPNAGLEFRTQRQTEFLLEALRLQQRASETGQKLMALQTETGTGCNYGNDLVEGRARLTTSLSLNSIRNNFRDIQRNLEIWLARIIGDVEGILARDGASRVNEYYISQRYPFVHQEGF